MFVSYSDCTKHLQLSTWLSTCEVHSQGKRGRNPEYMQQKREDFKTQASSLANHYRTLNIHNLLTVETFVKEHNNIKDINNFLLFVFSFALELLPQIQIKHNT